MNLRLSPLFLALLASAGTLLASPRDEQWKRVHDTVQKGLPQTAIEQLEPIISGATADGEYAEAVKAIGQRIMLEGTRQGNKPEEKIFRMQAEIAKAPVAMKPAMEAVLAHWYWQYFQQNRWRFLQRTQTAEAAGTDILTWDLPRILAEIDKHFIAALAEEDNLKATPVTDYNDLIRIGNVPDKYRPTMFDFLAFEALSFYQAGEQGAIKAEDAFELDANSPIFADAAEFMMWQPFDATRGSVPPNYQSSPIRKALRLYQKILQFHQADADKSAFFDTNLARLTYGNNIAVGENKADRYEAALRRFITTTATHEISARAMAALAAHVKAEGNFVEARELAQRGLDAFPDTAGGAMCFNLIQQIWTKSAQIETEFVWNAPWPTLNLTYRNVTKVYFRAIPVPFAAYLDRSTWGMTNPNPDQCYSWLVAKPALEWSAELPNTNDNKPRTEALPAPVSLHPGFYFIVASYDPEFGYSDNQLSFAPVWVSDLSLVTQNAFKNGATEGFVLQAESGKPVSGASVKVWQQIGNNWSDMHETYLTDNDGHFVIPPHEKQIILLAEHGGQAVSSHQAVYQYRPSKEDNAETQTIFFTDRSIYRPGQTIHYKGIAIRGNRTDADYAALAQQTIEVLFNDANGEEIARATHQTNDYGSFNGVFVAPRDRVTGEMSIEVQAGPEGSANFHVEEYKRPKFQVHLPAPVEGAKLNAPVNLIGKATAYTGAAIGGAKVNWRVERRVQLPAWCWWWQPPATQAIGHGTTVTGPDGSFEIGFTAAPDRTVPEKNEPVFSYSVYADVSDTTGETRSDTLTINVGYTALQARIAAEEWQVPTKPVNFSISTSSLDGIPQITAGTLTIHSLKQPEQVVRAPLQRERTWWNIVAAEPPVDPTNPDSWATLQAVAKTSFKTDAAGLAKTSAQLPAGVYRVLLETQDRFGKAVTARQTIRIIDPQTEHCQLKVANFLVAPQWSLEPGGRFIALWATGYETGRAFVELECAGKTLVRYWTSEKKTQQRIELPITEEMRGGVSLRVTYVRENRAYLNSRVIEVPWANKEFTMKWARFRSKLLPGQKETWTATIAAPNGKHGDAEMVATLYDASLDQINPHRWPEGFDVFRRESSDGDMLFHNAKVTFNQYRNDWHIASRSAAWSYRKFQPEVFYPWYWPNDKSPLNYDLAGTVTYDEKGELLVLSPFSIEDSSDAGYAASNTLAGTKISMQFKDIASASSRSNYKSKQTSELADEGIAGSQKFDLSKVRTRQNLNETAFFFPELTTNWRGRVKMKFTMPEALTEWKFMGFAHDKDLRSGFLTDSVVTAKDLMVEPNPPRFVREGDTVEFTVKVSNQSDRPQRGRVRLTFADAATLAPADRAVGNSVPEQTFDVPTKQSRSYSWRIAIPDGQDFLTYKAVGATADLSDGEEGFLPVLSHRVLVTESLPLPIRGPATKEFNFAKLSASGASDSLRHQSLTVQMVSQPAWYAVMALPYLMEFPHECSEQLFSRLYANSLARHIANSDPKIRHAFDRWKDTAALDSPLAKNGDLKSVQLLETPWVLAATSESEARRRTGLLFDANRLDNELSHILQQLSERQNADGLWSWFPGGDANEYISLTIVTGFGRLRHLGVDLDVAPALKALAALDHWMAVRHLEILKQSKPEAYVPGHIEVIYLYARSFFLKDQPIAPENRAAVDFFLARAKAHWLATGCRMCEAQAALALQRFGDTDTPSAIARSLKERSVTSDELGMYWRDTESGWWWWQAPIETQAMMIELFAEVAHDDRAVEDCQAWLLKQKQTQDWKTTKATADAVYALLLRGRNLLANDALVEVSLGGKTLKPAKVEAGTGFFEQKFVRSEIEPALGHITAKKSDQGVSWGSAHWQYLEDIAKITPHEGTPLQLKKTLWVKETTKQGPVLHAANGPLAVGDELVVRLELRTDRDMEFVHLKDQRGSGTEPVSVLSQYKYQDGLAYYESTRDTATHFYIDYLRKGTYVFEYSVRVQLKGRYQAGLAEIQSMYAPEFNSHSESVLLEVK